jgi:uncharacterized protein YegL
MTINSAQTDGKMQEFMIKSLLVIYGSIFKQGNVTEKWVDSRWSQIQTMLGTEIDADIPTSEAFRKFYHHFPISQSTHGAYKIIQDLLNAVPTTLRAPFQNLLEQGKNGASTGLSIIAQISQIADIIDINQLVRVIPKDQWASAGTALAKTLDNPWSCIDKPHVPSAMYADLKYLLFHVIKAETGNKSLEKLDGVEAKSLKRSAAMLEGIATSIKTQISRSAGRHTTQEFQLASLFKCKASVGLDGRTYLLDMKTTELNQS